MSGDKKPSLSPAVAALRAEMDLGQAAERPRMRAQQLSLLPSVAAEADAGADDQVAQRKGPGRPAGSRNRSTDEWMDFIAARYRSPLLFLAETYTRPVIELAAELECSKEAAYAIQQDAAKNLAPYWHQKQPMAVQVSATGEVSLTIMTGAPTGPIQPGDGAKVINVNPEPFQGLEDEDTGEVGQPELDRDGKGER